MFNATRSSIAVLVVTAAVLIGVASPPSSLLRSDALQPQGSGRVADGTTVFDDVAAVANLDDALRAALRRAAKVASGDGVQLYVNSGWRSEDYQEQLLDEAIDDYGSEEEAARWVATPETSVHVSGDAVDIGPAAAATWLARHGSAFGLCQVYDNEPWHFELRAGAVEEGCPSTYADPTEDPRLQ